MDWLISYVCNDNDREKMKMVKNTGENEIRHGRYLAGSDTETIWGWGSLAGKFRAERRAKMIACSARLRPGIKILEIGCGTGIFTEKFAETGARILAVDISHDLLSKAIERKLPSNQVQFENIKFEECTLKGSFDAIVGSSVLHHLDIELSLPKIFDLLRPGGYFCFAEPNQLNPQIAVTFKFRSFFSLYIPR